VETRWDTIDVGGDPMPTYIAIPDGDGPFPAVVVNMGLGSVEETIQELTRRMAEAGFAAAAPQYSHRQKDNILEEVKSLQPGSPDRTKRLFEKVAQLRDDDVVADGRATVAHLQQLPQVDAERIGVVGFCLGGRITYLETTAIAEFKASVPFYPAGLWNAWGDGPSAFDRSSGISCPVLGLFGTEDGNPSPEDMAKLDAELTRLGKQHEFRTYEAGHDFQNFRAARYVEKAAKESWPVMVDFFRKHLSVVS
jgi:carboxymethylenebutenolidase